MRRLLATSVLVLVLATALLGTVAAASPAQREDVTTTSAPLRGGDIIPQPNSGTEPRDAGDRGGALQTALFAGMVGGIVVMGVIVVRQSRRARAERGF